MKFSFINIGCKINQIEMEQASQGLVEIGYEYTHDVSDSDFLLINTCTVTAKADRKSLQTIRKYSHWDRLRCVFVTGCYSELEPELSIKIHPKNHIVSQRDKGQLPKIIHSLLQEEGVPPIPHKPSGNRSTAFQLARVPSASLENVQVEFFQHTRAFMKIQDGCNAFCSYCRIPFSRGAPVSRSYSDIIEHLARLRQSGVKEVVLSGINIGKYYDRKTKANFSQLLGDILDQSGPLRIKISSIEPFSLDEGFFDLVGHPKLAPHIHLPLQGLSDNILSRMNRRYRLSDYRRIVERIYRSREDFSIATDVIVGYPGESDEVYAEGKVFLRECGLSKIHVFPFSPRPFTDDYSALKSPHDSHKPLPIPAVEVGEMVKKERSRDLRNFSWMLERNFLEKVKDTQQNLILESRVDKPPSEGREWYQGTTEYHLKGMISLDQGKDGDDKNQMFPNQEGYRGKSLVVQLKCLDPVEFELA